MAVLSKAVILIKYIDCTLSMQALHIDLSKWYCAIWANKKQTETISLNGRNWGFFFTEEMTTGKKGKQQIETKIQKKKQVSEF